MHFWYRPAQRCSRRFSCNVTPIALIVVGKKVVTVCVSDETHGGGGVGMLTENCCTTSSTSSSKTFSKSDDYRSVDGGWKFLNFGARWRLHDHAETYRCTSVFLVSMVRQTDFFSLSTLDPLALMGWLTFYIVDLCEIQLALSSTSRTLERRSAKSIKPSRKWSWVEMVNLTGWHARGWRHDDASKSTTYDGQNTSTSAGSFWGSQHIIVTIGDTQASRETNDAIGGKPYEWLLFYCSLVLHFM